MGISEDANAAADYIEKHGWCRNTLRNEHGQVCLMGAIYAGTEMLVSAGYRTSYDKTIRANKVLEATSEYLNGEFIPEWNDCAANSQEEVVQVLRDVATKHMPDTMRSNNEPGGTGHKDNSDTNRAKDLNDRLAKEVADRDRSKGQGK